LNIEFINFFLVDFLFIKVVGICNAGLVLESSFIIHTPHGRSVKRKFHAAIVFHCVLELFLNFLKYWKSGHFIILFEL